MKKMFAALTALICAACCLALFGGCKSENFSEKCYVCERESVESVSVDVRGCALEIVPAEDVLRLEYFESETRRYEIALNGGTLTVTLASDGNFFGVQPDVRYRTLRLFLPDGLRSLTAATTNEDITLDPLACTERAALENNGGDICFEGLFAREISLFAKNGSITGRIAGGWDDFSIRCTVKKGESSLPAYKEDGENALLVDCNNGDVSVELKA